MRRLLAHRRTYVLAALVCLIFVNSTAGAGETKRASWTEFERLGGMTVDQRNGNVFMSGGDGTTFIEVFEPSGGVLKWIENEYDVGPMVVHDSSLYALRPEVIDVIDTDALEWRETISIPTALGGSLAMAGGRLWFAADGCNQASGELTGVSPTDGSLVTVPDASPFCPVVASPDPAGDTLFTYGLLLNAWTLTRWDASTTPPTPVVSRRMSIFGRPTFSPDGSVFYVPTYPDHVIAYSAHDLTSLWKFTTPNNLSTSLDVSPDGNLLAAGLYLPNDPDQDPDVYVFPTAGGAPDTTDLIGEYPVLALYDGVHFGPDGTLYVAAHEQGAEAPDDDGTDGQVKLHTLGVASTAQGSPTHLDISVDPSGADTYKVQCDSAGTLAGENVRLLTTTWYGTRLEKIVRLDEQGRCTTTIKKQAMGSVAAVFGGNGSLAPTRTAPVSVAGRPAVIAELLGGIGRVGRYRLYARRAKPPIRGSVQPIQDDELLSFRVQARVDGKWINADRESFPMSARGETFAVLKRGKSQVPYRVRTEFRGAAAPSLVSPWRYFKLGPHESASRTPRSPVSRGPRGRDARSEAIVHGGPWAICGFCGPDYRAH